MATKNGGGTAREKRRAPLRVAQRALLDLLRERAGGSLTTDEVLSATGWKKASWRVYLNNGLFDPYTTETTPDHFEVRVPEDLDDWEFHRQVSQSSSQRHIASPCKQPLARALVSKCRDNMILGLELYNRPSLENRLDAFAMLFCTAWEQLLKAEIIEKKGEAAIFKPKKKGRRRESISLKACVETMLEAGDPVRRNIEYIEELRHGATHLLMPPLQGPLSRLFQAGVLNFARRYSIVAATPLLPRSAAGLLSMVAEDELADAVDLKKVYGTVVADDLARTTEDVHAEIAEVGDPRFAVRVEYKLALTRKASEGDILLTSSASADHEGLVVIKPKLVDETHPWLHGDVVRLVRERLGRHFSSYAFQALLQKERWKASNNEYHHLQRKPDTHKYSQKAVDTICAKAMEEEEYLPKAREAYKRALAKRRQSK